jgi:alkylhydroperoxidase family enzyme
LHQRYGNRVQFLAVYVREAHPVEGWRMASNDRAGVTVKQPTSKNERTAVATTCCTALEMTMPLVVDELDDRVGNAYSGMPDRLYVIDRDGRVAYKSGRGPFGFKPGEMEQSLVMLLLDQQTKTTPAGVRVPVLDQETAWSRLPAVERGAKSVERGAWSVERAERSVKRPLPLWARALAGALPNTTAAMLELDYLHRAKSPLDPKLRGKMRWVAAHANRCAYAEACAAADLRRAGLDDNALKELAGDHTGLPEAERAALTFARKLTLAADTVSDTEMARLIELHGDKQVAAMVLLLAYANFQDRLLLTLGIREEPGGPLPPLDVHFSDQSAEAPPRKLPATPPPETKPTGTGDAEWAAFDFAALQKRMDDQRQRPGRIRVPTWDEVRPHLPKNYPADRPLRIRWSLVCMGYQPELALAWSACTRAFAREAKQDRVFEESLFWVVTRSLHCFY